MADVEAALERVLASGALRGSRLPKLLEYIVREVLEGRADRIKAYTIAIDVLQRDGSFDPQRDNVVRVDMGRLRKALDSYYGDQGRNDKIRISIPQGRYVPVFSRRISSPYGLGIDLIRQRPFMMVASLIALIMVVFIGGFIQSRPPVSTTTESASPYKPKINTLAVLPISANAEDEQHKAFARSLTLDLVRTLQNGNFLSVVRGNSSPDGGSRNLHKVAKQLDVRFLLTGHLYHDKRVGKSKSDQVTLSLIDGKNGVVLWSEKYEYKEGSDAYDYKLFLRNISFDLNPAYYAAAKETLEREGTNKASAIELFLISTWVPGTAVSSLKWELERIQLAKRALEIDPNYGPAHAVLADKLAYLPTVDPPSDTAENIAKSKFHADKVMSFADQKGDSLYNILSHNLHIGEIDEAARLANRIAALDPKNVLASFYSTSMVFTCKAASDEELAGIVKFHKGLNPRNPARWITSHTIGRIELNRGNYAETIRWGRESEKIFQSPGSAYQLAAALVQVGNVTAARRIFQKQRNNWPNLDASHFANVIIPRRCGNHQVGKHLQKVYQALAAALK